MYLQIYEMYSHMHCVLLVITVLTIADFVEVGYLCIFRLWAMPSFILKRQILMNLPSDKLEVEVAHSIDFMVERVSTVSHMHIYMYIAISCYVLPDSWS